MGIYVFSWKTLRKYLIADEADVFSSNDFGKNIIPSMLKDNVPMFAFPFKGYWKDVGTIDSFWEANMDLLDKENDLDLDDDNWKIYSRNTARPAQYVGDDAEITNSLVNEGCIVHGKTENSILSNGVYVGKNSIVKDSVIMPNVKIGDNVVIERAIINSNAVITRDTVIRDEGKVNVVPTKVDMEVESCV